jgi:uncharacterized protein YoxC
MLYISIISIAFLITFLIIRKMLKEADKILENYYKENNEEDKLED